MLFNNPETSRIFVFGSNLVGRHGKGAALHAKQFYGAKQGEGVGHFGQSYAIPTKNSRMQTQQLDAIEKHVDAFLLYAMVHPNLQFNVTQIGCGLAGLEPSQIAPMFNVLPGARGNLWFDKAWAKWLEPGPTQFWSHPI